MIDFIARVVEIIVGISLACVLIKLFDLVKEKAIKFEKFG